MVADGHMLCGLMLQKMIELFVNALGIGIAAGYNGTDGFFIALMQKKEALP